jgi:ribosome biogenesis protein BRX1
VRSNEKKAKAGKYVKKVKAKQRRKTHLAANPLQPDELADVWED